MSNPLLAKWKIKKKLARLHLGYARFIVFCTVFLSFPLVLVNPNAQAVDILFQGFASVLIVAMFFFNRISLNNSLTQSITRDITDTLPKHLKSLLDSLRSDLELCDNSFKVQLSGRRYNANPSVVYIDGNFNVIIPLGFLKLAQASPNHAKAILAHELAHIAQKDAALWQLILIYSPLVKRVIVPIGLVKIAFWIFIILNIPNEEHISLARGIVEYVHDEINWEFAGLQIAQLFLAAVLMPFAFLYGVKKMRYKSEELADLAAAGATSPCLIRESLELFCDSSAKVVRNDSHPLLANRLEYIDRLKKYTQQSNP